MVGVMTCCDDNDGTDNVVGDNQAADVNDN